MWLTGFWCGSPVVAMLCYLLVFISDKMLHFLVGSINTIVILSSDWMKRNWFGFCGFVFDIVLFAELALV